MYNPMIYEALKMYETMTSKHVPELYFSRLVWKEIERDGVLIQIVPCLDMEFKF